MTGLLDGIRVAEVANSPAVRYCGLMFALAGASVTRYASSADGRSHLDRYLDHGKRMSAPPWQCRAEDVLIADPGFDWPATTETGSPIVSGTVEAFAVDDDRAGWQAPEIVLAAIGGAANYTKEANGVPVYGFGHRFQFLAGEYLFIALTAMLGRSEKDYAPAPRVRVAASEAVTSLLPYGTTQYAYNQTTTTVEQSGPRFLVECRDGFLCVYAGGPWQNLALLLDGFVEADDQRFVDFAARFGNVDQLDAEMQRWASGQTIAGAIAAADRCSIAVAPCYNLDDVLNDESLHENGTLLRTTVDGRDAVLPGLPMRQRA